MASVARGKALVAKLRAQPGVRDAEALAAWIGRFKKARKAGKSVAKAKAAAGGASSSGKKSGGSLADRVRKSSSPAPKEAKRSPLASKFEDDDDPFAEDYGQEEEESKEDKQQRRMEEALMRKMEKEDRSTLYQAITDVGGIKTNDDLREEYRQIPNNLKRKDGLSGDEMADYLKTYFQELGIEDERDLIDYFQTDYRRAA